MSEIPDLFNEPAIPQHSEEVGESKSSGSKSSAWIIGLISLGLVGSAGVTAYYGLGPMLAKPYQPPVNSQAPDIATVLGIGDAQLPQGHNRRSRLQIPLRDPKWTGDSSGSHGPSGDRRRPRTR